MKTMSLRSPSSTSRLAAIVFALALGSTALAATTMKPSFGQENYEVPFVTPWEQDGEEGMIHLEHVTVRVPTHGPAKRLYYHLLGFMPDARRAQNIEAGNGTIWANVGTTQVHLLEGEPQVVPGEIGVVYSDLKDILSRLEAANAEDNTALEGTKFSWTEEADGILHVTCPYGNMFRLHEQKPESCLASATATSTGNNSCVSADDHSPRTRDPRGGRLPSVPASPTLSPLQGSVGIAYVRFRVKPGTGAGIARFYREVFAAHAEEFEPTMEISLPGNETDAEGASTKATAGGALVRVGPVQHLAFVEDEEALPEYDGHHICVYMSEEGFLRTFAEAKKRGLMTAITRPGDKDTLEGVLEDHQFRITYMNDPANGELLHILEHEVRSVTHPAYPVGRDVPADAS